MKKNRHNTKKQMYALIRKWKSSGLAQVNFCQEHQISISTFGYWRKKYLREETTSENKSQMIPVHIQPQEIMETVNQSESLEIVYPNGVRIVCPARIETSRVKDLIF